jgi:hypothetical protein
VPLTATISIPRSSFFKIEIATCSSPLGLVITLSRIAIRIAAKPSAESRSSISGRFQRASKRANGLVRTWSSRAKECTKRFSNFADVDPIPYDGSPRQIRCFRGQRAPPSDRGALTLPMHDRRRLLAGPCPIVNSMHPIDLLTIQRWSGTLSFNGRSAN